LNIRIRKFLVFWQGEIKIKFYRSNPNNVRPDQLRIEYDVDGEILVENFENIAGGGK